MKINSYLALAALVLAVVAFTACSGSSEAPAVKDEPVTEVEPVAEEAEEPAEEAVQADLDGIRVAVLIAAGFHDGETMLPKAFLEEHGAVVTVLGPEIGELQAYNSEQLVSVEMAVVDADVNDFDLLILPGGRGPAVLREHEGALDFARAFMESGKPIAAICHGPQLLISADLVEGRTLTCYADVASEIVAGGGTYVDQEVMVDGNLITSRVPGDIPAFNAAILAALQN